MRKLFNILLVLSFLLLTACGKSVLSDVEITDPSLLKVKVEIEQENDDENIVWVRVRDTKGRAVRLKNGEVWINDCRVDFQDIGQDLTRGYKYFAEQSEEGFNIAIHYNSREAYSFSYGYLEGFPGFGTEAVINYCPGLEPASYRNEGTATLKPAPFHNNRIDVSYSVFKHPEQMPDN